MNSGERNEQVLVVRESASMNGGSLGPDLGDIVRTVLRNWRLCVSIVVAFAVAGLLYALLAAHWYRAETVLAPVNDQPANGLAAQFGEFASLAGIGVNSGDDVEALAVLVSRDFVHEFIIDNRLMPILYAKEWDSANDDWLETDPEKQPDLRDGIRFFREDILTVEQDSRTKLVTVAVEWTDPEMAAHWANLLVERLNSRMRERALAEATANVEYLRGELEKTSVLVMQQSVSGLLESELRKLMMARGNKEFSFRVIDQAAAPKYKNRPQRLLILVFSTVLGGFVALLAVYVREIGRR